MIVFEREHRTKTSEAFVLWEDESLVGRVDLHYQGANVHATLCTTADASEERIHELIDAIDERLVMTADPYRDDLVVTVWRGSPAGVYSDSRGGGDDDQKGFQLGDLAQD
ncbi:MAG TPA: hypothetical protein QGF35_08935 [Dehalococcoidia bacterium]|nr:hypothetical protein [Dehalococcoidia bacterium]